MSILQPTYYTRHPDETYSVADPQPTIQPVKQEPVAIVDEIGLCVDGTHIFNAIGKVEVGQPLYAAPVSAKREWVDLTDDDINKCVYATFEDCPTSAERKLVSAVIAAFKEKNK